jgi:DNA-directed RNA polymerase subunit RPC12/RpoP
MASYHKVDMAYPIKICAACGEEFELKPNKPGFANRCPDCSTPEETTTTSKRPMDAVERKSASEANAARRQAMRDLLYRKDS